MVGDRMEGSREGHIHVLKNLSNIFRKRRTRKKSIFWDATPCIPLKVHRSFGGTSSLHLHGRRISQARNQSCAYYLLHAGFLLGLSFDPQYGATYSSEMCLDFQCTATWRYIPENRTPRNHRWENLKSYKNKRSSPLNHFHHPPPTPFSVVIVVVAAVVSLATSNVEADGHSISSSAFVKLCDRLGRLSNQNLLSRSERSNRPQE
jgi:hypothetical protein